MSVERDRAMTSLRAVFEEDAWIVVNEDGFILGGPFTAWRRGVSTICLDGEFTVDQLDALAGFMRAMIKENANRHGRDTA